MITIGEFNQMAEDYAKKVNEKAENHPDLTKDEHERYHQISRAIFDFTEEVKASCPEIADKIKNAPGYMLMINNIPILLSHIEEFPVYDGGSYKGAGYKLEVHPAFCFGTDKSLSLYDVAKNEARKNYKSNIDEMKKEIETIKENIKWQEEFYLKNWGSDNTSDLTEDEEDEIER